MTSFTTEGNVCWCCADSGMIDDGADCPVCNGPEFSERGRWGAWAHVVTLGVSLGIVAFVVFVVQA